MLDNVVGWARRNPRLKALEAASEATLRIARREWWAGFVMGVMVAVFFGSVVVPLLRGSAPEVIGGVAALILGFMASFPLVYWSVKHRTKSNRN